MREGQAIERCKGPFVREGGFGLIPDSKRPIIDRAEDNLICQYLQSDGTCSAIKELLPEIVTLRINWLSNVRAAYKSEFPTRRKTADLMLRDATSDLAKAASMASALPVCRFLKEQSI